MFKLNTPSKKTFKMHLFKDKSGAQSQVVMADSDTALARSTPLPPQTAIPTFSLSSTIGDQVSSAGLLGKSTVLVFYPADWTPVCSTQLALYNEILPMFQSLNAQILGVSVDSVWSHHAFAEERNLSFPLLADFEPKGLVAQQFGVYHQEKGFSQRALFVIDQLGINRWTHVSPLDINPGADGILNALESIQAERWLS